MSTCPGIEALEQGGAEIEAHLADCPICRSLAELMTVRSGTEETVDECARAELLIAAGAHSERTPGEESFLRAHLARCETCRETAREPPAGENQTLPRVEREHYLIGAEIGRGGMGRVVSARDLRIGRAVALKEVLATNHDALVRFEREARITTRLQHPGIVSVYEVGCWPDGRPFYAMPILSGRTLREAIRQAPSLRERMHLLPSLLAAADAVAYAHSRRIIHRDLTPANIQLGRFGETVVIDWGIAKDLEADGPEWEPASPGGGPASAGLTVHGAVIGTPAYIAPEQAAGETVDERADVYALGAILYELLSGKPPFGDAPAERVLERLRQRRPPPRLAGRGGAPRELVSVAEKAMHPDPAHRYPSAAELAEELRRHQLGQRVLAHPYSRRELATRWLAPRVGVVIAAAAALVLVAAAAVLGGLRVARERNRAEATTRALLVEQGRQQTLAGHPARALAYLEEAERRGERSPALAVLLSAVRHSTDGVTRTFPSPGPAMSIALSPDGRSMAVAHTGGITIQDPASGRIVRQLAGPTHCLDGLRFTGDGAWLATFGPPGTPDNGITIWDTRTWTQARVLAPGRDITGVDLSADGRWLVATGADGRGAELWEIASGHRRGSFLARIPGDRLRARFSPDGRQLLTFGHHEGPILRDVASGQVLASVTRAPGLLESADVSADGRRLVTGGPWGAQLWALPGGEPVAELVAGQLVGRVAFSPDGARLLAFTTEEATLFASEDGTQVAALGVVPSYWAEFSPDGSRIGVVRAGVLETLSAQTGLVLESHEELDAPSIVTFTPDGRELVAHYLDLSFRFFDLGASLLAGRISNPLDRQPYNAVKRAGLRGFGDGGRTVLATGADGALAVWDRRGQVLPAARALAGAELLALSGDGMRALLATPGDAGRLLVRDTSTGAPVCQLAGPFAGRPAVTALASDGSLVLTAVAGGEVALWDGRTGARTAVLTGVDHPLVAATFSADGSRLYLGETGKGTLWDPRQARRIATLFIDRGGPATFSPDGRFLALTGDYARLWHAGDGTFAYSLLVQARPRLSFSRDSAYLAVLGDGLTIVDVTSGRQLARIEQTELSAAIFAQSSELLITVGRRITTLMEWRTQRTLAELPGDGVGDAADQAWDAERRGWTGEPPPVVALSPDGQQLALSHRPGGIEVLSLGDAGRGARSFARPWPRPWHLEAGQLIRTERPATAAPAPPALNPRPQNLDFEAGPVGAPPPGWVLRGDHRRCTTSADHPRGGQRCALLEAAPNTNDDGGLRQFLDARPYRGKMVNARAYLRCAPGTPVLFRMLVTRDGEINTPPASLDAGSACTDQWQPVELSRYVDEDAHRLSVGVWLDGPGQVWIDDLALTTDRPRPVATAAATKTSAPLPPRGRTADQILDDFLRAISDAEPHRPRTLYVKNRLTILPEANVGTIYGIQELWFGPAGTRSLAAVEMGFSQESVRGGKSGWIADRFGFRRDTAAVVRAHEGEPTPITQHRRKGRFPVRMVVPPPPGAPRGARLECVALSGGPGGTRELDCFDATDHLLVYAEGVVDGTAYRDFPSDYRTIAGIKVATRDEIHAGKEVHIYDLLEAEGDVKLDEVLFRTPDRPDSQGAAH